MSSVIFLAEINHNKNFLGHNVIFNQAQVNACLAELNETYDEVLVVSNSNHLLLLVVGHSPLAMLDILSDLIEGSTEISTSSSQNAVSVLMTIAKGSRWPDVSLREIRKMITTATHLSMELNCFGETLRRVVEALLFANARCCKKEEYSRINSVVFEPSMARLDFSRMSLN